MFYLVVIGLYLLVSDLFAHDLYVSSTDTSPVIKGCKAVAQSLVWPVSLPLYWAGWL